MILEQFKNTYHEMNLSNVQIIEDIYSSDIHFEDPFHTVEGLDELKTYFERLYQNVDTIGFEFKDEVTTGDDRIITWVMNLKHPKLNKGEMFSLEGATHLKLDENQKIKFHKDYFDGGAMLYEKVPVVGSLVRWIKGNL